MNGNNKYKFIAALTALFLIPFLILSRHFIYGERELERKDILRYLELRTQTGAGIISDVLNLNYSLTRLIAGAGSGQAGVKDELRRRVKETPFIYSELALLGPSGSELARFSAEKSVKARPDYGQAFAEAKESRGPAGAVEYGDYTPPALVLCEPRAGAAAKPEYYLAGRLSLAYLGEVVRMMGKNSSGNFGLVDAGGQIIADSMSMSIVKPGLKAPPEVVKLLQISQDREAENFSSEVFFRGRTYLASVSAVGGTRWWIYEIMDDPGISARQTFSWAVRVVLSGVLLIVVFSVVSYLLALRWLKEEPL